MQLSQLKLSSNFKRVKLCLPCIVTALRLLALPFLLFSASSGNFFITSVLFIFAIASDLLDGTIARRLHVSSKFGANLDAIVDFVFIGSMFYWFIHMGYYPSWVLLLIVAMFGQFMMTSSILKMIYDPLGKYYGSMLYGTIGLTLLFPSQSAYAIILAAFIGATIASITSRILYALKLNKT